MLTFRQVVIPTAVLAFMTLSRGAHGDDARESLWRTIRAGDLRATETLLDQGADANAKNEVGITALLIAIGKGQLEIVKLLVERGADVNARDGIWYQTPLSTAVNRRQADTVKFLIGAGAKDFDAALVAAAASGNIPVLQAVLESGKVGQDGRQAGPCGIDPGARAKCGHHARPAVDQVLRSPDLSKYCEILPATRRRSSARGCEALLPG